MCLGVFRRFQAISGFFSSNFRQFQATSGNFGHDSRDWSEYENVIGVISEPFAREFR